MFATCLLWHKRVHSEPLLLLCCCCLQVTVMDGSGTSRQATVWVIVHIQDENDNKPEFPETVYRISVPERGRSKRGDPIYRVFAYDRDEGPNADLTYSIVDGNQDGKFFIDAKTAMVSSRKMVTAGSYDILTVWEYMVLINSVDILLTSSQYGSLQEYTVLIWSEWGYTGIHSYGIDSVGLYRNIQLRQYLQYWDTKYSVLSKTSPKAQND